MAQDKIRIHALAHELGMKSKDLLDLCLKANINAKNQLSTLTPEQREQLIALVKRGGPAPAAPASPRTPAPLPKAPERIRNLNTGRPAEAVPVVPPAPAPTPAAPAPTPAVAATPAPSASPTAKPTEQPGKSVPVVSPVTPAPEVPAAAQAPETPAPPPAPVETPAAPAAPAAAVEQPTPRPTEPAPAVRPATPAPAPVPQRPAAQAPAAAPGTTPPAARPAPGTPAATPRPQQAPPPRTPHIHRPVRELGGGPRSEGGGGTQSRPGEQRPRRPITVPGTARPQFTGRATAPPQQHIKKPGEENKGKQPPTTGTRKIGEIPPELMGTNRPPTIHQVLDSQNRAATPLAPADADVPETEDEDEKAKKKKAGEVAGRKARHQARNARAKDRQGDQAVLVGRGVEEEGPRKTIHRLKKASRRQPGTVPRKEKVQLEPPITIRSLSEAIGVKSGEIIKRLMGQGVLVTINSTLETDTAEEIALEMGAEIDIRKPRTAEDELLAGADSPDDEAHLAARAPVVTIMGHVDHGKTSLLDRIRKSNVVDTEAGGITQSLRAWRVEHNGRAITFLDTPGHEAFTKMRARGANVTDIAVIVVAATDGVMPQTEEAISHAKAAEVAIVVAINKIDMPNANVRRTEQQLYGMGLLPDNMGGDIPFVHTSAVTGAGIDDLLEAILLTADVQLELKANPDRPATGTCLEASISEGEGVLATVLVQNGTLRRGDVVLCGAASGRVRAMYSDMGLPLNEAGPSVPCRVTGLDEVPNADDPFHVVLDLATAADIAEQRKTRLREQAQVSRGPVRLEDLAGAKIVELKIILKADVRGSVEAIRKELEKLRHDEVRVRVLHTGLGAINESDVALALTSPEDTLIVGFNVVADDRGQSLADERGIQVRQYNIIYKLTDDIRSALEGKLKPREEIVPLGRAIVRETFKISRVGTIAGCYVTQGTIERSGKVRLVRQGVVVYPPPERTVGLDSLKRFKDDVREVQQGYECGIKIAGYDDIKVDDVIECYRVEQVQRTLS